MYTITGSFKDGVAKPDRPVQGHEGQAVLITFLDTSPPIDAKEMAAHESTLEEVVARIASRGPSGNYTPPVRPLSEAFPNVLEETPIDSEEWNRQWAEVEADMKRAEQENDQAEGRL